MILQLLSLLFSLPYMPTAAAGAIATIVASTATKTVYQLRFIVTEGHMDLQVMAGGDFDGDLNMLSFSL